MTKTTIALAGSKAAVKLDAKSRAARTFLQGLGWDVLFAIATALLLWLPDADLTKKEAWLVLGTSLAKTVLTAAASYVARFKLKPPAPIDAEQTPGSYVVTDAGGDDQGDVDVDEEDDDDDVRRLS